MMKFRKTILFTSLLIGLLFVSILSVNNVAGSSDYGVLDVYSSPEIPQKDQFLMIYVDMYVYIGISQLKLLLCTLSPEFLCEPQPRDMIMNDNSDWEAHFLVEYDNGTHLGYHIQIVFDNASSIIIPDRADFLGLSNIVEPLSDEFFFSAGVVGGSSITTTPLPTTTNTDGFSIFALSLSMYLVVYYLRRKRKSVRNV